MRISSCRKHRGQELIVGAAIGEDIAELFFERATHWTCVAAQRDSGGITREIANEMSRVLTDTGKKLKTSSYKKGVITQYYTIVEAANVS